MGDERLCVRVLCSELSTLYQCATAQSFAWATEHCEPADLYILRPLSTYVSGIRVFSGNSA